MYQKIRNKFRERPTLFYACSIVASWAGVGSLMNFRTIALNYGAVPAIIWAVFNSLACILFGLFVDRVPSIRRIMQSKAMFYFIGLLTLFQTWTQMSGISRDALSIRAATGTTLPMAWLRSTATTRARIRGRTLASAPLYLIVRYCKLAGLLSVQRDKGAGLLGCRVTAAALKF